VDNRPGASGSIGHEAAAKAAPDGYTILLSSSSTLVNNTHLFKRLSYDPLADFAPISFVARAGQVLVVQPAFPAASVRELIALAKAQPGKLNFGSGGKGIQSHISAEMFKAATGVDIVHVPYKGAGAVYGDLIAGVVQMMFANISSMLPQVRGGKVRGLAVTSAERSKVAPDLPTIAETLPGYVATSWYGAGAPAGTPEPILAKLEAAITAALANPEIQKRWTDELGLDLPPPGRRGFDQFLAEDRKLWAPAVKASGVKLD
jgi:tripartite-type tricarboxylate transporter receptor subunit TctC